MRRKGERRGGKYNIGGKHIKGGKERRGGYSKA